MYYYKEKFTDFEREVHYSSLKWATKNKKYGKFQNTVINTNFMRQKLYEEYWKDYLTKVKF